MARMQRKYSEESTASKERIARLGRKMQREKLLRKEGDEKTARKGQRGKDGEVRTARKI